MVASNISITNIQYIMHNKYTIFLHANGLLCKFITEALLNFVNVLVLGMASHFAKSLLFAIFFFSFKVIKLFQQVFVFVLVGLKLTTILRQAVQYFCSLNVV